MEYRTKIDPIKERMKESHHHHRHPKSQHEINTALSTFRIRKSEYDFLTKEGFDTGSDDEDEEDQYFYASDERPPQDISTLDQGTIEIPLSLHLPENEETADLSINAFSLHFQSHIPQNKIGGRWSGKFRGGSVVRGRNGSAGGSVGLGYDSKRMGVVCGEMGVGGHAKMSLVRSMKTSNGTFISTGVSKVPTSPEGMLFGFSMHRNLIPRKLQARLHLQMSKERRLLHKMHLGLTSQSSETFPLCHLNLYLPGTKDAPLQISTMHPLSPCHKLKLSLGCGRNLLQFQALLRRTISSLTRITVGVRHNTLYGCHCLLRLQHANHTFSLPICISTDFVPSSVTSLYVSFLMFCVDSAVSALLPIPTERDDIGREVRHTQIQKMKMDAQHQLLLMSKQSSLKKISEKEKNGLVIVKASYGNSRETLDVTIPLQFWVMDSRLDLPGNSKAGMMGFYNVCTAASDVMSAEKETYDETTGRNAFLSRIKLQHLFWWWNQKFPSKKKIPKDEVYLFVRYEMNGQMYEIKVGDEEGLVLPNPHAVLVS